MLWLLLPSSQLFESLITILHLKKGKRFNHTGHSSCNTVIIWRNWGR